MIYVHVKYKTKPGQRKAYLNAIRQAGYLKDIHANPGCLGYDYYYAADDEDVLLLVECWRDAQVLEEHMGRPYRATQMALREEYVLHADAVHIPVAEE